MQTNREESLMWTHSMVPHYPSVTHQSPHRIPEKTTMEIGISVTNPYPILVQCTHPCTLTSFGDFHISSNELRLLIIKHVGHFIRTRIPRICEFSIFHYSICLTNTIIMYMMVSLPHRRSTELVRRPPLITAF